MTLEELITEWKQDSIIEDIDLDTQSLYTAQIHAKYLEFIMNAKRKQSEKKREFNILRANKFRYYRGEMSQQELKDLSWSQWQGVKPIKSEMDEFLKGDVDLNNLLLKTEYIETYIYVLDSIMTQIKGRDWQIRNAITFKQFIAG